MQECEIRKLEVFIRDIINDGKTCIDWNKLENENKTFLTKTKELFKFENDNSWRFLTSSLDVIGDSQFAINNFLATKYDNISDEGEAYLKIYGIFSAVYIQYKSIKTIARIVKVKNEKDIYRDFERLDMIFLRHVVSAHPVDYKNDDMKIESYKLDRRSIENFSFFTIINEKNEFFHHDLFICLEKFKEKSIFYLRLVAEKTIKNRYSTDSLKIEYLINKLDMIKHNK
jgi:hypothetical protein